MTWTSKTMPDEALTDCLVGAILQGQQRITGDGSGEALPEIDGPVATGVRVAGDQPLWDVMEHASYHQDGSPRDAIAAEIESLRDWLVPSEEPIRVPNPAPAADLIRFTRLIELQAQRLQLRQRLTEQARIARGEG